MTKQYTRQDIIDMLDTKDLAVYRGLVAIYNRQTSSEQACQDTREANNVGFNSADARILSYRAEYVIKNKRLTGNHLTDTRKRLKKYWRQLLEIANNSTN